MDPQLAFRLNDSGRYTELEQQKIHQHINRKKASNARPTYLYEEFAGVMETANGMQRIYIGEAKRVGITEGSLPPKEKIKKADQDNGLLDFLAGTFGADSLRPPRYRG